MAVSIQLSGPKLFMHNKTIAEMFMVQLENNKGLFGIDCITGTEYTYAKLKKDVFAMATAFRNDNLGRGDVVMSVDYGSYEGQVVLLAGLLIGATVAALDYNLKKKTLAALVNESRPDVLFCNTSSVHAIADILNMIEHRPQLKISTATTVGFVAYSDIVRSDGFSVQPTRSAYDKRWPSALVFSSGTTGVPKGVHLSDDAIKAALISFMTLMEEPVENRFMITSPVFWYTGILLLMLGVHSGKPRLFFSAKPTSEQILCAIDMFKPTFLMTGVAAANDMMSYQMTNGHKYNIESLITFVVGGSPMRPKLQKMITENLLQGRIPIKQGYGASEQGILALWSMKSDINTVVDGSVGKPAAGVKFKIVDLVTGESMGPNKEGEIRIKSVSNMIGYAYDMKKTVNSYDEDGWFKSGDVGYYTNDGCLFIVGRIKELMIYKDIRISPIDIETALLSHPAVLDAGVTSRDSFHGDLVIGVVKVKQDQQIKPDQLVSYVNDRVDEHEQLRGDVIFVEDIPRSPAGKLKRDELKLLVK